ncbi:MAG: GtrA family protein [Alkalispirochaeta sp.]
MRRSLPVLEFGRYGIVSVGALSIDFAVLTLLTSGFGVYYLVSAVISYSVGLIFSYVMSVNWVFATRTSKSKAVEFSVFVGIGLLGLVLNAVTMWLFTSVIGLVYLWSRVISAGIAYSWKYVARRLLLFRGSDNG